MKNWKDSWRALERAYAEGRVMSIGVINFDINLLNELLNFASIKPHVIQNYLDLNNIDHNLRKWCQINNILYQPYVTNFHHIDSLPHNIHTIITNIADKRQVSYYNVWTHFFIQIGVFKVPECFIENHVNEGEFNILDSNLSTEELAQLGYNEL